MEFFACELCQGVYSRWMYGIELTELIFSNGKTISEPVLQCYVYVSSAINLNYGPLLKILHTWGYQFAGASEINENAVKFLGSLLFVYYYTIGTFQPWQAPRQAQKLKLTPCQYASLNTREPNAGTIQISPAQARPDTK